MVAALDGDGQPDAGTERGIDCDLVAVSGGSVPSTSLLLQAGAKARWDEDAGAYVPGETPPGIFAAGAVAGHASPDDAEASGRWSPGRRPRSRSGSATSTTAPRLAEAREALGRGDGRVRAEPSRRRRTPSRGHGKCFACLCEDVTTDDIDFSIDEGFDSLELLKRYTTVTMGPCQGRMCQLASIRQMAEHTGTAGRRGRADHRAAAVVERCRWACWPAGRSSRRSAPRSTGATASSAATCSGPATGAGPTTTAIPRARRWRCTRAPG